VSDVKAWLRGVDFGSMDVRPDKRLFARSDFARIDIDKERPCDPAFCSAF